MPAASVAIAVLLAVHGAGEGQSGRSSHAARAADDPDRVVCRRAEPSTGSRVARQRVCRTVAEWRVHEQEMARLRRDLQNTARGLPTDE